jgi:hypothetical protein
LRWNDAVVIRDEAPTTVNSMNRQHDAIRWATRKGYLKVATEASDCTWNLLTKFRVRRYRYQAALKRQGLPRLTHEGRWYRPVPKGLCAVLSRQLHKLLPDNSFHHMINRMQ